MAWRGFRCRPAAPPGREPHLPRGGAAAEAAAELADVSVTHCKSTSRLVPSPSGGPLDPLPLAPPLRAIRWVERGLKAVFVAADLALAGAALLALAGAADPAWRWVEAGLGAVLALAAAQLAVYAFLLLCTVAPWVQSYAAYGHPASWLGLTRRGNAAAWARRTPQQAGLKHARCVAIETRDGELLGGWHVLPGGDEEAAVEERLAARRRAAESDEAIFDAELARASCRHGVSCAVYYHGMGESRRKFNVVEHAQFLAARLGLHVLVFDYRGFAESTGFPLEAGLYFDAEAALSWLMRRGVPPANVLIWGHSLGSGLASHVALQQQELGQPLRALILEAAYTSYQDAAQIIPSMVVVRAVPFGAWIIARVFRPLFSNADRVPLLKLPILQLHGTHDIDLPFTMGQRLAQEISAAGAASSFTFVPLHGCGHLLAVREPGLYDIIVNFLSGASERDTVNISVQEI
ncbi:hypothetical protein AB1Y20_002854 [Prymnesium parvum]|uniref:AB hydrolase-1 domain-containing protein n=1 Tax=Prymnesium parvum TaxID=97485 RepID=A0AB34JCK9_PRYPA